MRSVYLFVAAFILRGTRASDPYVHNCTGDQRCYNQNITCPDDRDCVVDCSGLLACSFTTILCPNNEAYGCSLNCYDDLSCTHLVLSGESAASLSVVGDGKETLLSSTIYCPELEAGTCNITYSGHEYGLNSVEVYTPHHYDSIRVSCNSVEECWSSHSNPILYFGDEAYSMMCMLDTAHTCLPTLVDELSLFVPTDAILSSSEQETTEMAATGVAYHGDCHEIYPSILISIGVITGIGLSVVSCLLWAAGRTLYRSYAAAHDSEDRLSEISVNELETNRSKSSLSLRHRVLSPSLRKLSPVLNVARIDIMDVSPDLSHATPSIAANKRTGTRGGAVVTVERYNNADNCGDESVVRDHKYAMSQSSWMSFDPEGYGGDMPQTIMPNVSRQGTLTTGGGTKGLRERRSTTLSICMEGSPFGGPTQQVTPGIRLDEFVISSDGDNMSDEKETMQ